MRGLTPRRIIALVLLLGALGSAAGCGGGGGESETYTLEPTRSCFEDAGYPTAKLANPSLPAAGGHLRVQLDKSEELLDPRRRTGRTTGQQYVFLVFAADRDAALATQKKAIDLAEKSLEAAGLFLTRDDVKQGLGLSKNVLYYSTEGALTQNQRTMIDSCLR